MSSEEPSNLANVSGEIGATPLDEATSAIDPESEHEIRTAMGSLCARRTVIVVAHRLPSIVQASRIAVFDRGRIAGSGTHEQLLRDCVPYQKLWEAQLGARTVPPTGQKPAAALGGHSAQ